MSASWALALSTSSWVGRSPMRLRTDRAWETSEMARVMEAMSLGSARWGIWPTIEAEEGSGGCSMSDWGWGTEVVEPKEGRRDMT